MKNNLKNAAHPTFTLPDQPHALNHRFHAMVKPVGAVSAELNWSANSEGYGYEGKGEACWDLSILFAKELARENLIKVNGKEFRKPSY